VQFDASPKADRFDVEAPEFPTTFLLICGGSFEVLLLPNRGQSIEDALYFLSLLSTEASYVARWNT